MFRWRLLSRQIHFCHNKYVETAPFSSPEDSSVHTIVTGKYFLRFWLYLGLFAPVYFLWSISSSWKSISLENDNSTFVALSKGLKLCIRNVYLIIFDLGICVLIGQSELSTLCHVPGLLTNSPGYEVGVYCKIELLISERPVVKVV